MPKTINRRDALKLALASGVATTVQACRSRLSHGTHINAEAVSRFEAALPVPPVWVTETLIAFKMDPGIGLPAVEVAKAYVRAVEGNMTGQVLDAMLQPVNRP